MPKLPIRRNTNRIPEYDYSEPGYYFITICTQNRVEILGTVEDNIMRLNDAGIMINHWWKEMFKKYHNISKDEYIIMPNHIHGIINIVGVDLCVDPIKNRCVDPIKNNKISHNHNGRTRRSAPTIASMVQWVKTMTTNKYIQNIKNNNWQPFDKRLWQRNYYEHIIRNNKSLNNIRRYIKINPSLWQFDWENPKKGKYQADSGITGA